MIIADSTLDLPGVLYAMVTELRHAGLCLLWIVAQSGAGAQELKYLWERAPACTVGLTVYNLNDALTRKPWAITPEVEEDIGRLVDMAKSRCCTHAFVVNDADFFPGLRPPLYKSKDSAAEQYRQRMKALEKIRGPRISQSTRRNEWKFQLSGLNPRYTPSYASIEAEIYDESC